jgi:hypothetical protein
MNRRNGILSNPWLVTVAGGLIVAILSAIFIGTPSSSGSSLAPSRSKSARQTPSPARQNYSSGPSVNDSPGPSYPFTPGTYELPDQLIGTWSGTVFQASTAQNYPVVLRLSRAPGTTIGTSEYRTLGCQGELRLNSITIDTAMVAEYITSNSVSSGCVSPVQITLRYLGPNRIFYSFSYDGNPEDGQGTLTKSSS